MKLDEAIKILKENKCHLLKETTAIGNPELLLGYSIEDAIDRYMNLLKAEIDSEEEGQYKKDAVAFYNRITAALDNATDGFEEELGSAVLKVLGVEK